MDPLGNLHIMQGRDLDACMYDLMYDLMVVVVVVV